jgi:hypothetical protein
MLEMTAALVLEIQTKRRTNGHMLCHGYLQVPACGPPSGHVGRRLFTGSMKKIMRAFIFFICILTFSMRDGIHLCEASDRRQ